ncbi:TniQ family protein [Kitasatospora sp. NPDC127121]|uniref:TniQ family protein n=1 Tax=Kitasatospora sp. NPDC127121 TaxID=3345371 RepID=UPI00363462ED
MAELHSHDRPLARSLDPLPGESLGGYLLRLAHRLRLSPIRLARLTGCTRPSTTQLGRRLLLDLDTRAFAHTTRLSEEEATALTLVPWSDRYLPIARLRPGSGAQVSRDDWLFNDHPRYCPRCLAGDGTAIQQQHGGPWKKAWHLPVAFACPVHQVFLQDDCPRSHWINRAVTLLVGQPADANLHPAQCRHPVQRAGQGRKGPSCGTRLDQLRSTRSARPSMNMLRTQQRLLDFLEPHQAAAADAASGFTDLRVVTAALCASWPLGRDHIEPDSQDSVGKHIKALGGGTRPVRDRPPSDPVAAAGLLTAAVRLLDEPDLHELVDHARAARPGSASRAPWVHVFERHQSSCSDRLRQAMAPLTRTYRRTGPRGARIPERQGGYRPEHIPAFLEERWYQEHLAPLQIDAEAKSVRRLAAVLLVQQASGRARGDAADFLGINPAGGQFVATGTLLRWLRDGQDAFNAALHDLAEELDRATDPTNYQRRRELLRIWSLSSEIWNEIITRLPPVPGPVRPNLDDRVRQEASAFVWAYVTGGEPLFAPRHVEAEQPPEVRQVWRERRANTWFQLSRPDALNHYTALRRLLCQHGDALIAKIESGTSTPIR